MVCYVCGCLCRGCACSRLRSEDTFNVGSTAVQCRVRL